MDLMEQVDGFDPTRSEPRVIVLRIDELVLEGLGEVNGDRIGAALEHELSRLVVASDVAHFTSPAQIESLNAGGFRVEHGAQPNRIGGQIAQRVYGQLARVQPTDLAHNTEGGRVSHA